MLPAPSAPVRARALVPPARALRAAVFVDSTFARAHYSIWNFGSYMYTVIGSAWSIFVPHMTEVVGGQLEKRPDCVYENPVLCMHEFIQNSATRFISCNFTR
eukprot:COSAG02_NODE_6213_length_3720_cov_1.977630_1_plen_101_part_10